LNSAATPGAPRSLFYFLDAPAQLFFGAMIAQDGEVCQARHRPQMPTRENEAESAARAELPIESAPVATRHPMHTINECRQSDRRESLSLDFGCSGCGDLDRNR